LLKEESKSDLVLKICEGSVLEKNCIFLNAVESFTVDIPTSSKLVKLRVFVSFVGDNITCEGVKERFNALLWCNFHSVLDFNELELVLKYFNDRPIIVE
jgi:hypothetical protein